MILLCYSKHSLHKIKSIFLNRNISISIICSYMWFQYKFIVIGCFHGKSNDVAFALNIKIKTEKSPHFTIILFVVCNKIQKGFSSIPRVMFYSCELFSVLILLSLNVYPFFLDITKSLPLLSYIMTVVRKLCFPCVKINYCLIIKFF